MTETPEWNAVFDAFAEQAGWMGGYCVHVIEREGDRTFVCRNREEADWLTKRIQGRII